LEQGDLSGAQKVQPAFRYNLFWGRRSRRPKKGFPLESGLEVRVFLLSKIGSFNSKKNRKFAA